MAARLRMGRANQNPASEGLTTEAGFRARYSARRKLAPRADTRLAEQGRNRDHHPSDPSSQAKKQKEITQEHRHVTPPSPPLCWATLTFQEITFIRHPTHWALKLFKNQAVRNLAARLIEHHRPNGRSLARPELRARR